MNEIKVTHPCGKVETIKGDFKDGVKIELVKKEKWWCIITSEEVKWRNSLYELAEFQPGGFYSKKETLQKYIEYLIHSKYHLESPLFPSWMKVAVKELVKLHKEENA